MTSPIFGRRELREIAEARAKRHAAYRHAAMCLFGGFAFLLASVGAYAIHQTGLSAWLAICAIGAFGMVAVSLGDAK